MFSSSLMSSQKNLHFNTLYALGKTCHIHLPQSLLKNNVIFTEFICWCYEDVTRQAVSDYTWYFSWTVFWNMDFTVLTLKHGLETVEKHHRNLTVETLPRIQFENCSVWLKTRKAWTQCSLIFTASLTLGSFKMVMVRTLACQYFKGHYCNIY